MKKEYDFSKAIKGKFFVSENNIELPIYLDKNIRLFYSKIATTKKTNLNKMINSILKKEMEIHKTISSTK
jgi:hypothetical protein